MSSLQGPAWADDRPPRVTIPARATVTDPDFPDRAMPHSHCVLPAHGLMCPKFRVCPVESLLLIDKLDLDQKFSCAASARCGRTSAGVGAMIHRMLIGGVMML